MLHLILWGCVTMGLSFTPGVIINPQQKSILIEVTPEGKLGIDQVPVLRENLAREVQQRLWRSYMSNGKMLQYIRLKIGEGVNGDVRNEVLHAIRKGREQTLTLLSLHKHKKKFEDIGSKKQARIRKQFPVLFREDYQAPS